MAAALALRAIHGAGAEVVGQLLVTVGDNPERIKTEAQFAALAGVAPVPASSGKTGNRHRLSRGGDRGANAAIHRIVLVRLGTCERTQAYVARRTQEGRTKKEIMRCLKRFVAREIFNTMFNYREQPAMNLRPIREQAGFSMTHVANELGVWPTKISRLERGITRNPDLETRYRNWLNTQKAA